MNPTTIIVALTGGSGAGKTTVADALTTALSPHSVLVVREDDYYFDNAATPDFHPERFNFDHVETRDHALLAAHLAALKAGQTVQMPRYDFVGHRRMAETAAVAPADIVIVEGTHVLHPTELRALYDHAIYLDLPDDIRLMRRIQRDVVERQRSLETVTDQYVRTVRPMHYRFTDPARDHADAVVTFDDGVLAADRAAQMENLRAVVDGLARDIRGKLGG